MNNEPRLTASLLSACPPDDAQQRRLEEVLAKKYGKPVSLTWQEDKTAAGGFRIRLGSEIIDWTAEGRLTQLKDKLASLRPGEGNVISLIRDTVRDWTPEVYAREEGHVLSVADGIAYVEGLDSATYGEILLFEGGIRGMVQELRPGRIGCILFGRVEESARARWCTAPAKPPASACPMPSLAAWWMPWALPSTAAATSPWMPTA